MSLSYNGTEPTEIIYNGTSLNVLKYGTQAVWGKPFTLSISQATGTTLTVNRTSSPNQGASTGTLASGATIYYGDVLTISGSVSEGFNLTSFTVNGTTWTSGNSLTITSAVSVVTTSSFIPYTLTIATQDPKSLLTSYSVRRTSSPAGGSIGTLSNGATIYYLDYLVIEGTSQSTYTADWLYGTPVRPVLTDTGSSYIKITSTGQPTLPENIDVYYDTSFSGSYSTKLTSIASSGGYTSMSLTKTNNYYFKFKSTNYRFTYNVMCDALINGKGTPCSDPTTYLEVYVGAENTTITFTANTTGAQSYETRTDESPVKGMEWKQVWSGSNGGNFTTSTATFSFPTRDISSYQYWVYADCKCTHKSTTTSKSGSSSETFGDGGYTITNGYNNKKFYFDYTDSSQWTGYTTATAWTRTGYLTRLVRYKPVNKE